MNYRPIAVGLVLGEQVIIEEGTHNATPVNCFSIRALDEIPGITSFCAVAWLADGKGKLPVEVIIQRLNTARFIARVRDCTFPVEGYYEVSLLIDRELVAHRKFRIQLNGANNE